MQLSYHQLRLRGSLFDIHFGYPTGPCSQAGQQAVRSSKQTKDTQSQHLRLVVKRDDFSLQTLAQAGEARDMAPDAEIFPRSRSRHLLRQETGAPALRKTTRCRIETKPGRVEVRRVMLIHPNTTTYISNLIYFMSRCTIKSSAKCFNRKI